MVAIPAEVITRLFASATLVKLALSRELGLNLLQLMALTIMGTAPVLSIRELKGRLAVSGSSLTFTLDSLESKGLIKRRRNRNDRRQWLLKLSKKGDGLYKQVQEAEGKAASLLQGTLSEAEMSLFIKLADQVSVPKTIAK